MAITRDAIDAILAEIGVAKTSAPRPNADGIVGYNAPSETADLEAIITKIGGTILNASSLQDGTRRLHYVNSVEAERWAYIIDRRPDIDVFTEESVICSAPILDDPIALTDAIVALREETREQDINLQARLNEIDAKWAEIWPDGSRFQPRALAWLMKSKRYIGYAQQIDAQGALAVLTWPDETLLEKSAKEDVQKAIAAGAPVDATETAREFRALAEIYKAAGLFR